MRRVAPFFKTFTPASAGGMSYVDLAEQKGTYFELLLEIKKDGVLCNLETMKNVVDYVELLVNNTRQRKFTVDQLYKLNKIKKKKWLDGYLKIYFSESDNSTSDGEDSSVWSMDGVSSFEIKVHWKTGAHVPSINGFRIWHPTTIPAHMTLPITYVEKQFNEVAGTRILEIDNDGREINHIHFFTDKIKYFKYSRNDTPILEGSKYLIDSDYAERGYVPLIDVCSISQKMLTSRATDKLPARISINGNIQKATHVIDAELTADAQFNTIIEVSGRWR